MKHFLYRVAETFFQYHSHDINRFTFVFPNRRAGLFFQQYLSKVADKAFFSPEIITIGQWFELSSGTSKADQLYQLFTLYELFQKKGHTQETFDNFAFWGDIILNDFNEVDKYCVDAGQLFQNITDLKSIEEQFQSFSENQLVAIRSFWKNFNPMPDKLSQREFVATWSVLHDLYIEFKQLLKDNRLAYEGMMMREVTEKLEAKEAIDWIADKEFVFVGFNALNACEKRCMQALRKMNKADFYWDYDSEPLRDPDNPASRFYKENTLKFPSTYSIESTSQSIADKQLKLIQVPSGVGQVKEIFNLLNYLYPPDTQEESFLQTAIVLPDEQLLLPLLYSVPKQIQKINVTMGYPMNMTPVAGLMDHIFELHRVKKSSGQTVRFYHQNVINILNHQFIVEIEGEVSRQLIQQITAENKVYIEAEFLHRSELTSRLFSDNITTENFLSYVKETLLLLYRRWKTIHEQVNSLEEGFIYQYHSEVSKFQQLIEKHQIINIVNLDTLIRIVREITSLISIPFVGEPLDGLQVMGVLETRGLDFRNVIISSFNEGVFPGKSFANSLIPYQLRKGFELPTYEHSDAVSSYNFYRLLHHADSIFFISDTRSENGSTGEVSRYYYQLKYYYHLDIEVKMTSADVVFNSPGDLNVKKDARILELLKAYTTQNQFSKALSASAINTYINCPLQFCLSYLETIQTRDEIIETIESDTFGNILHAVMAELYTPFTSQLVTDENIKDLLTNEPYIERLISQAFGHYYFKKPKGTIVELEGNHLLIATILKKYIKGILNRDRDHAPFVYIGGEKQVRSSIATKFGKVNLKGYIDRIDQKEDKIRILDYKTGSGNLSFNDWDSMFEHNITASKRPKHILQTLLYGYLYKDETNQTIITPGLFYTKQVFKEPFSTELIFKSKPNENNTIHNYYDYENEFLPRLISCIEEMMNPDIPFFQTHVKDNCTYCDFKTICKR
jgi:hypothetical protein